ncbi:MAG: IclR family transcriptional regulator [Deltaproteobacteria bacterium]|nr:IclR family transcriptional regulator [Deltaproteobacteria bacterium]
MKQIIEQKEVIPALSRGLDILDLLAAEEGELGFMDIARRLDIPKPSLLRILRTLMHKGFIIQDDNTKKYKLGLKIIRIGNTVLGRIDLRSLAREAMRHLSESTRETVELSTLDRDQLILIDQIESPEGIRLYQHIGSAYPYFHTNAVGKVYLAYMDPEKRRKVLGKIGLPKITEYTITEMKRLERELEGVRSRGYAFEDQELRLGLRRLASPIFDHENKVIGCLSVAGPIFRIDLKRRDGIGEQVWEKARELSQRIGAEV